MISRTRRNAAYILAGISFCVLSFLFTQGIRTPDLNSLQETGIRTSDINKEENYDLISNLYFSAQKLVYDAYDHTWYYSLIEEDRDAYSPRVTFESSYPDVSISVSGQITEEMIRNNQPVIIHAENDQYYADYQLKCTTLPIMTLECDEDLTFDPSDMEMTVFDNRTGTAKRLIESSGTIHVRGMSSAEFPKKGLRLSLTQENSSKKNKVSLLGMRKDEDWILIPGYTDEYNVRNTFSSNLWTGSCGSNNLFNVVNGNHYEYIELFMNGRYWGLYSLGYPIDQKQLDIDPEDNEYIYKKRFWDQGSNTDYVSSTWKIMSPYGDECNNCTYEWKPLQDYYHLLNEQADDPEALKNSVDMDSAIDIYLFYGLIQGVDNAEHSDNENMMVSAKKDAEGNYKILYTAWDVDLSWGELVTDENKNTMAEGGALGRLIAIGDQETIQRIYDRYHTLRTDDWSDAAIDTLLDRYETDIFNSGAYYRDYERWPESVYNDQANNLSEFRAYVHKRLAAYDDYIERWYQSKEESVYVLRSTQYKDFTKWKFIIQLNDHAVLNNPDYADLFKYIGLNTEEIPEEAVFIFYDGETGDIEYQNGLWGERENLYSAIGRIIYERSDNPSGIGDDYQIYLDGEPVLEIWQWPEEPVRMGMIRNHDHDEFNFSTINEFYLVD